MHKFQSDCLSLCLNTWLVAASYILFSQDGTLCKGGAGAEGGDGTGAEAGTLQDGADRTDTDLTEEQADIDSFPE